MRDNPMLIIADKPSGISSFDVIRSLKRQFPRKTKIGHAGTLDPMASGLMLIGVEKGTKLLHQLTGFDKTYEATINFSKMSDTRDMDYWKEFSEIHTTEDNQPTLPQIEEKLQSIIGTPNLPLTPFSARKARGKKLYEYARAGKPIFMDVPMTIHNYKIIDYTFPELKIELHVGSGTYIRSIAYRLGQKLGTGGILTALRRTSIENYKLTDYTLDKKAGEGKYEVTYTEIDTIISD